MSNLRKVFYTKEGKLSLIKRAKDTVAVDDLSCAIYKGEIFCLLGVNGAGKSTTIGILTGLFSPTSGEATVLGLDVQRDMSLIRQYLGVAPQFNAFWDKLSAEEHCYLFAAVKGIPLKHSKEEIDAILKDVSLSENRSQQVHTFSGGMKRKLAVALALIGDPPVIFLDEPTSGMDPLSRRSVWTLLQREKSNKVVILTTHSMVRSKN